HDELRAAWMQTFKAADVVPAIGLDFHHLDTEEKEVERHTTSCPSAISKVCSRMVVLIYDSLADHEGVAESIRSAAQLDLLVVGNAEDQPVGRNRVVQVRN